MQGYGVDARLARDAVHVAVGDLVALPAVAVVAPAVERAADAVVLDPAADGEVRAEVRAVRVDHVRRAVVAAEQDHVAPEDLERAHLARRQVARFGDDEPAVRDREREARLARRAPHDRAAVAVDQRLGIPRHREPVERLETVVVGDRHGDSLVQTPAGTRRKGASPWTSSSVGPMRSTSGRSASRSTS